MKDKNKLDSTYAPISLAGLMASPESWDDLPIEKLDIGGSITMKWARQWITGVLNQFGMDYVVEESTGEDGASKIVHFRVTNFFPDADTRFGIAIQSLDEDSSVLELIGAYHRFGASMLHSSLKEYDRELSEDEAKELSTIHEGKCSFSIPDWVDKFAPKGMDPADKYGELCLWLKTVMAFKVFLQVIYTDLRTLALRDCQDQLLYLTKDIDFHPADFDKLDEILSKNSDRIVTAADDIISEAGNVLSKVKEALQKDESKEDNSENESEQA